MPTCKSSFINGFIEREYLLLRQLVKQVEQVVVNRNNISVVYPSIDRTAVADLSHHDG
jgi:hypothetical protein